MIARWRGEGEGGCGHAVRGKYSSGACRDTGRCLLPLFVERDIRGYGAYTEAVVFASAVSDRFHRFAAWSPIASRIRYILLLGGERVIKGGP